MADDDHERLVRGDYRAPTEGERIEAPPLKSYGPNGELWIDRTVYVDGELIDFGVTLQWSKSGSSFHDVARFCVAHSNKHIHRWAVLPGRGSVKSGGPIDTQEQLVHAYYESQSLYTNAAEEVERWGRR